MSMKKALLEKLLDAVADWDGDFAFDIEKTDAYEDQWFFDVTICLKLRGVEQEFSAKVEYCRETDSEYCYMSYGEDAWEMISQEALFTWLWFDLAHKIKPPNA